MLAERWRREYNQRRPHSAFGLSRRPAPEARQDQSFAPWEWTPHGPRSNLEGGPVPGGRFTRRLDYGEFLLCPENQGRYT